jgi:hypothetical protein
MDTAYIVRYRTRYSIFETENDINFYESDEGATEFIVQTVRDRNIEVLSVHFADFRSGTMLPCKLYTEGFKIGIKVLDREV